jgi:hypothetical protein
VTRAHDAVHRSRDVKPPVIRKRPQNDIERHLREPRVHFRLHIRVRLRLPSPSPFLLLCTAASQAEEHVAHVREVPALREKAQ